MRWPSLLSTLLLLAACGGADYWAFESVQNTDTPHSSLVVVWLSDSPVDGAEALEVTIDRVELVRSDAAETLEDREQTLDLFTLRNGARASIAEAEVPAGDYQAVRLTLRPVGALGPRMRTAGVWRPLVLAPGASNVIDVPFGFTAIGEGRREIHIDFNARMSVLEVGPELRLTPVLDAVNPLTSGEIVGRVLDAGGVPVAGAIVLARFAGNELRSTITLQDGSYRLTPLPPGAYDVELVRPMGAPLSVPGVVVPTGGAPDIVFNLP